MRNNLKNQYLSGDDEEYMGPAQLEYFRMKLLKWKKELISESLYNIDSLKDQSWASADYTDLAAFEADKTLNLQTKYRQLKLINQIDEAIKRIDDGEYGYCEDTGEEIGLARLEARPIATLCIEAQERYENYQRQYNDE